MTRELMMRFRMGGVSHRRWEMALVMVVGGCAARTANLPVGAGAESERTILQLQGKNAGYVRRIEELENRVFILEDQLDSQKLAAQQKAVPSLPVRRLSAAPVPGARARTAESPELASAPASLVDDQSVEYVGDAVTSSEGRAALPASPNRSARPRLRLTTSGTVVEGKAVASGRGDREPLRIYRAALEALRAGHHPEAIAGFRRFLLLYPQHDYADNAQYWMGESFYDSRQFGAAEREFRRVIESYPNGNKVPDAMLKLGFTLHFLGDTQGSRAVLESLTRSFPKHESAVLASAQLAHPSEDPAPPHPPLTPASFGRR
jgi:tol-pal system protein YbgF